MKYEVARNLPVLKFYYKGKNHSHPVRRTILRIPTDNPNIYVGYELREGSVVRKLKDAPVKSYNKSKIATFENVRRDNAMANRATGTTLKRENLLDLIVSGI